MEALLVDVKCYEAFDELITNSLMLPSEGITIEYEDIRLIFIN